LRRVSGGRTEAFSNQAEKLAGRLVADLNFSALEDIKTVGMHEYMDETQVKLNDIGEAIYKTYLFCPQREVAEPEVVLPSDTAATLAPQKKDVPAMSQDQAGMGQTQTLGGMKQRQG
jgi:hypothetical protein